MNPTEDQALGQHLLTLPPEIRETIYGIILDPDANRLHNRDKYTDYNFHDALVLFKINKQIYLEARKVWRDLNTFVRIETPWSEAQAHVAFEGHCPILVKDRRAELFRDDSLHVKLDAPYAGMPEMESSEFVILLEDLEKFTRTWFYADLSHPELNPHLRLTLTLRDPYSPEWEEKRMPRWLQRKLLMPFGMVKNLRDFTVKGDPAPFASIEKEVREEQAKPHLSPEHCLRETTRLKEEGNTALKESRYHDALECYERAWQAMHIVVAGRQRHVHADAFFGRQLKEPPFIGKSGPAERLRLRVQLVANTCLVYLKMKDYNETRFWGMRTISFFRDAMGIPDGRDVPPEDEVALGFPAEGEMGKIYYRTALAFMEMGERAQARRLLRVAAIYLPREENVKKALADTALKIG